MLDRIIEAHGGCVRWRENTRLRVEVSAGGLAFTLKRRPPFRRAVFECEIAAPKCRLTPIGRDPDVAGVLEGGTVRLETSSGEVIARRDNARAYFPYGRRLFWWDDLDMAYFANYAFWNYLTLPARLMSSDLVIDETAPGRLVVDFPNHVPTHCRRQVFHFDPDTARLLRHDYTADVIGGFARAANVVLRHAEFDGVPVAVRRRITPRGPAGGPLARPVLIDIEVHDFALFP